MARESYGTIVARGAFFNILGWLWPALLYLVSTPIIIEKIGVEAFGVLSLLTLITGYLSPIAAPFAQANIKYIAEYTAKGNTESAAETLALSVLTQATIGIAFGFVVFLLSGWLCSSVFNIPQNLLSTSHFMFRMSGVLLPIIAISGAFGSALQGTYRFDTFNLVNGGLATASAAFSIGIVWLGFALKELVLVQAGVTITGMFAFAFCSRFSILNKKFFRSANFSLLSPMLSFSSWVFINQSISLLTFQLGKTAVGITLDARELAYYTIANNFAIYLQSFAARLSTVFFPLSAELFSDGSFSKLKLMYERAQRIVLFVVGAAAVIYIGFGRIGFHYWLGADFEANSYPLLCCLTGWGLLHALGAIPYNIVNGSGKPRINALFAIWFGAGNLLLILLFSRWGSVGIALASLIAALIIVPIYIYYIEHRIMKISKSNLLRHAIMPFIISSAVAVLVGRILIVWVTGIHGQLAALSAALVAYALASALTGLFPLSDLKFVLEKARTLFNMFHRRTYP